MGKIKETYVTENYIQWFQKGHFEELCRAYFINKLAPTIVARGGQMVCLNEDFKVMEEKLRIRKLTPRECWRLMGQSQKNKDGSWDDSTFDAAEKVNSNAQLYKQAGNSIVVDVLVELFKEMEKQDIL